MADILFSEVTTGLPTGNGYFDVLMRSVKAHIQSEYDAGRIKGADYANVYLGAIQSAMQLAEQFVLSEKMQEAQIVSMEKDAELKIEQLRHMVRKYDEDAGRWVITEDMMHNQKVISDVDVTYKPLLSAEDLTTKQTQIAAMLADIAFNTSKKTIMEYTRKDNIRMKATEQFAEFLKYISAADVVPSEEDFKNIRKLVTSIVGGLTDPDSTVLLVDPTKSFQAKE